MPSARYYEMLCDDSTQLYWGRDLWHIHTIYSLDEPSKQRIISKRQQFIEEALAPRHREEQQVANIAPSDDVCETSIGLFGSHLNSLVVVIPSLLSLTTSLVDR